MNGTYTQRRTTQRQNYGLGSKWQDFKDKAIGRVRKIIPNELANVATKAAPFSNEPIPIGSPN